MLPSTFACRGAIHLIVDAIQGLGIHAIQPVCLFQQGVLKHTLHERMQVVSVSYTSG